MARPPKKIDAEQVKKLAAIQCSHAEMGSILGCSADTLERRYAAAIKEGRENGRASLKRKQYEIAMGGHVTMLIWLGKQYLDQSDRIEQTQDINVNVDVTYTTKWGNSGEIPASAETEEN